MKEQPETESLAQVGPDGFALPIRKRNFLSEWFENPFKSWTGVPTFGQILKWKFTETNEENVPDQATLDKTIPVHNLTKFEANSSFYATWLGHATVLVHMEGANFITDPIWAERASPMSFAGPARYRPPPMKIEDLPKIDFGVISHDHYDHLDEQSVKTITAQNPSIHWFVPLKIKKWMRDAGIQAEITEMNWGDNETVEIGGNSFTIWCLPAQHWGQRSAIDRNRRLWSGWSVHGPTKKFFYTGDTGYCEEEFVKIGQKFGPFNLAAIPIGAYAPRWFMKNQHIDPEEAFKIHQHVKSKRSIGIHWGTYHMGSYEFYLEPKERLDKLMEENEGDPFTTIEMGTIWQEDEATETSGSSSTSQL